MFRRSQTTPLAVDGASFFDDDDDNDPLSLRTQPPSVTDRSPRPETSHLAAADGASLSDNDDDTTDDDDPLLTQPPLVVNTVRSPSPACNTGEFFLDSIRRTIDNEQEFNKRNAEYRFPPPPPVVIIPDYIYILSAI